MKNIQNILWVKMGILFGTHRFIVINSSVYRYPQRKTLNLLVWRQLNKELNTLLHIFTQYNNKEVYI